LSDDRYAFRSEPRDRKACITLLRPNWLYVAHEIRAAVNWADADPFADVTVLTGEM